MITTLKSELRTTRGSTASRGYVALPRDAAGRIIKRGPCDVCGYGTLQYEGNGVWKCDGLAAPERDDEPLIECPKVHINPDPPHNEKLNDRSGEKETKQ